MSLRVRVLGGIAVAVDDHSVTLPPRVQLLLAALVAHRADGIDPDALLDAVYEGNPPDTAAAALRVHLAKLRDALEPGRERGASTRIARTHGRWRLRLEPDESDVGHFDSLVAEGTQVHLDGDPALAAQLLSAAVDAWSGNPFPGLDSPFVQVERQRLIGLRREVDRRLAAAWLDLGRDAEALSCVRRAREDDPFDERLAALEARARYQSAGPAAALEVIRSFRAELADELGLDPSSLIDEVETAVLRNDAALLPSRVPSGVRAVRSTSLIGRDGLLDEIAGLAPEHSVVCLEGVAGIGKSALLREVAAQHDTAAPASARAGRTPFALIHDLLLARGLTDDEPGWRDLRAYCSGAATPHDSTVLPLLAADLAARHLSGWVLVDDAETIDQASLDLLAQQVPRGVRLLLARRPSAAGRAHLDGLQPWVITVPPLTPEDSRRLAARLEGHREAAGDDGDLASGGVVAEALAAAGGIPLLIEYAVRETRSPGGLARRLMADLGSAAREGAELLAVLGAAVPMPALIDRVGSEATEELLVSGVATAQLDRVGLAHPLAQEAIRADLGAVGANRLLAAMLATPGAIPPLLVIEAVRAHGPERFPPAQVAALAVSAGEEALRLGDPNLAAELFAQLPVQSVLPVGTNPDPLAGELQARAALGTGLAKVAVGETVTARGHLARAGQAFRTLGQHHGVLRALESYVGMLAPDSAESQVVDGHAEWLLADEVLTPDERVLVRELQSMAPDAPDPTERVERLLAECQRAATPRAALSAYLGQWRLSHQRGEPAVRRLEIGGHAVTLATQLGERDRLVRALRNHIDDLIACGDRDRSLDGLGKLRLVAQEQFHAEARWWCDVMDVGIRLREEPSVEEILGATFAAHAAWPQIPAYWRDHIAELHAFVAMFSAGARAELLPELQRMARGSVGQDLEDRLLDLAVLTLRTDLEPVAPHEVRRAVEGLLATPPGWRRPAELYLAARAASAVGDPAPDLVEALQPHARAWICLGTGAATLGPVSGVLAALAAVAGDEDLAETLTHDAVMRSTDMHAPSWAEDTRVLVRQARAGRIST